MESFDPFEAFGWGILALSAVYFVWQFWSFVVWIGELPRVARKYAILTLLRVRGNRMGRELVAIGILLAAWIAALYWNVASR